MIHTNNPAYVFYNASVYAFARNGAHPVRIVSR
jgi:hypothetical protein